jgi:hypothetical protein
MFALPLVALPGEVMENVQIFSKRQNNYGWYGKMKGGRAIKNLNTWPR